MMVNTKHRLSHSPMMKHRLIVIIDYPIENPSKKPSGLMPISTMALPRPCPLWFPPRRRWSSPAPPAAWAWRRPKPWRSRDGRPKNERSSRNDVEEKGGRFHEKSMNMYQKSMKNQEKTGKSYEKP